MSKLNPESSIFSQGWINLVFENLNQKYGAYVLRKMHKHILGLAIILTTSFVAGTIAVTAIINRLVIDAGPIVENIPPYIIDLLPPPEFVPPVPVVQVTPPAGPAPTNTVPVVVASPVSPEVNPETFIPDELLPGASPNNFPISAPAMPVGPGIETIIPPDPNPIHIVVDVPPAFPGGELELIRFLQRHIRYPGDALSRDINGIVYIEFVVNSTGVVTDAVIRHGIGGGCDEEALRVVNLMPNWKPGRQAGIPVSVRFNLPIRIAIK